MSLPPADAEQRIILFRRGFHALNGAALKAWDYFNHIDAHPQFKPLMQQVPQGKHKGANPFLTRPDLLISNWLEIEPAAFFVGTYEWESILSHPAAQRDTPIFHLVQSLLHADPTDPRNQHLGVKAIRIAVSPEVAAALEADPNLRGPVFTIPNGISMHELQPPKPIKRPPVDVFIGGLKRPAIAEFLQTELEARGYTVRTSTNRLARNKFLANLRSCRVAVTLPGPREGFFLPALEAMALGAITVCPDCIGNRSFCVDGVTGFRPEPTNEAILAATLAALALPEKQTKMMRQAAAAIVEEHTLVRERSAFHRILDDLDLIWAHA